MPAPDPRHPIADLQETPASLTDEDITTVRVDRRSFLSRAVAAGSVAVGAALTTRCGGQSGTDSDAEATDSDGTDGGAQATDSDGSDSGAPATDPEATDSDSQ